MRASSTPRLLRSIAGTSVIATADKRFILSPSFRDGAQHQTRNLEIPGSMLRIAPE